MERTITRTFEDFKDYVMENIFDYLPEEYRNAELKIQELVKPGYSYTGLTINKSGKRITITPVVNLTELYQEYQDGKDLETIMEKAAKIAQIAPPSGMNADNINWLFDYNQVRTRLFIRVSNTEFNPGIVETAPHRMVADDLAITCHIVVNEDGGGISSTIVNNDLLERYNVTADELFNDALENSPEIMPVKIKDLFGIVSEIITGDDTIPAPEGMDSPLVITNQTGVNGAAALFYPGVLEKLERMFNGSYFILPSSVHEVLILPDDGTHDPRMLSAMVADINHNTVEPKEWLANNAYRYNNGKIETI